jgi:hypothetical protein
MATCPSTGSSIASKIKSQSSLSQLIPLFMRGYGQRLMDWIKASTEGHELDRKWKVPEQMIGRRLSQEEAKRLLAKFE